MPESAVLVFAGGPVTGYGALRRLAAAERWEEALVVAADGGMKHCAALGLRPQVVIGDLDSLPRAFRRRLRDEIAEVIGVPEAKEQTDLQLALELVSRRAVAGLTVVGATGGGRLDHSLAAVYAGVPLARDGWRVRYLDGRHELWLLAGPSDLTLHGSPGQYLSVLALSEQTSGVFIRGTRWELEQATLRWGESRGISNEFGPGPARLGLKEGVLAVVVVSAARQLRPRAPAR